MASNPNKNGGVYNINTTQKKDKTGLIGKALISTPNVPVKIAEIRQQSVFGFITLRVSNINDDPAVFSDLIIWISNAKKIDDIADLDIIEYKIKLAGTASLVIPGLTLSPDEKIYVQSSMPNIVVRAEGSENNPL